VSSVSINSLNSSLKTALQSKEIVPDCLRYY